MDNGQSAPPPSPSGAMASPSAAQPAPGMNAGAKLVIRVVDDLRALAKAYPKAAPFVSKINDLMPHIQAAIMSEGSPGEPQAPPSAG
jgi:hypothetical protein